MPEQLFALPDEVDRTTIARQIGRWNIAAISGGRIEALTDGIRLPVAHGYAVEVVYDRGTDTYTVRRTFTRSGRITQRSETTMVYAGELGEVAYAASCGDAR